MSSAGNSRLAAFSMVRLGNSMVRAARAKMDTDAVVRRGRKAALAAVPKRTDPTLVVDTAAIVTSSAAMFDEITAETESAIRQEIAWSWAEGTRMWLESVDADDWGRLSASVQESVDVPANREEAEALLARTGVSTIGKQRIAVGVQVFEPPSQERVTQLIRAPNAVTGEVWTDRIQRVSKAIDAEAVSQEVAVAYSRGDNPAKLRSTLRARYDVTARAAGNIARMEMLRVGELVQRQSWQPARNIMAGVQIIGTIDDRIRPHHAARSGTIWWKPEVGREPTIDSLPLVPDEYNCRCFSSPVLDVPAGDPVPAVPIEQDPGTIQGWFAQQPLAVQRRVVGGRRFDLVRKRLGDTRPPEYSDFLDPATGRLMSLKRLDGETPAQLAGRGAAARALLQQRAAQINFANTPTISRAELPGVT